MVSPPIGARAVTEAFDEEEPPAAVARRMGPLDGGEGGSGVREEVVPILRVADAAAAVTWYGRLGFIQEWEHRFGPGFPAFVSVARGGVRLFLSEHAGDARPDTLVYLRLGDVDAIAATFGTTVEDAPWAREIELRDPDGNRLRVGTPKG